MKAKVKYRVATISETIDLEDYGCDDITKFEDLPEDDQNEIIDSLRDGNYIEVIIETIDES